MISLAYLLFSLSFGVLVSVVVLIILIRSL
jgi:hypothetical protein